MNKPGSDPEFEEVASSYLDVWGKERAIDAEVRAALLKAMGPARKAGKVSSSRGAAISRRCSSGSGCGDS